MKTDLFTIMKILTHITTVLNERIMDDYNILLLPIIVTQNKVLSKSRDCASCLGIAAIAAKWAISKKYTRRLQNVFDVCIKDLDTDILDKLYNEIEEIGMPEYNDLKDGKLIGEDVFMRSTRRKLRALGIFTEDALLFLFHTVNAEEELYKTRVFTQYEISSMATLVNRYKNLENEGKPKDPNYEDITLNFSKMCDALFAEVRNSNDSTKD